MYSIFRIEEYFPESGAIQVRFCEEQSHYPINQGKAVVINCKDLDCYSADTFAFSLMRGYGNSRIRKQKKKQPVLPENEGSEIEGNLNIQDLVGKVIKVKDQPRIMNTLKTRRITL